MSAPGISKQLNPWEGNLESSRVAVLVVEQGGSRFRTIFQCLHVPNSHKQQCRSAPHTSLSGKRDTNLKWTSSPVVVYMRAPGNQHLLIGNNQSNQTLCIQALKSKYSEIWSSLTNISVNTLNLHQASHWFGLIASKLSFLAKYACMVVLLVTAYNPFQCKINFWKPIHITQSRGS